MKEPCDGVRSPGAPGHFEWWYFDFPAGADGLARIEWHAPLFNLRDGNGVLVLRCYERGEGPRSPLVRGARFPLSRVTMDRERCAIRFPGGSILEEEDRYRIAIDIPAFTADLSLARELPPPPRPDGAILNSGDGRETFSWCVPLPRARAGGALAIDGRTIPVDGIGYHDHNWGNLRLGRWIRRWTWLRVPFHDLTLIFARIDRRDGEPPLDRLVALDKQGQPVNGPPAEAVFGDERTSACGQLRYPASIDLRFGGNAYRVHLEAEEAFTVAEEPLGALGIPLLDNAWARAWYAGGRRFFPLALRRRAGRLLYLQAVTRARLTGPGSLAEETPGVLEVFHCEP